MLMLDALCQRQPKGWTHTAGPTPGSCLKPRTCLSPSHKEFVRDFLGNKIHCYLIFEDLNTARYSVCVHMHKHKHTYTKSYIQAALHSILLTGKWRHWYKQASHEVHSVKYFLCACFLPPYDGKLKKYLKISTCFLTNPWNRAVKFHQKLKS